MKSILLVLQDNRYSFSPIITVADSFLSDIEIIFLKEPVLSYGIYDDDLVLKSLEKQLKNINLIDKINIFFFSIHSWYRRFFFLVLSIIKKYYPESLLIAGGPDVIAKPDIYVKYFDLICYSEGELFLIDLFENIYEIENSKKTLLLPENIFNCASKYNRIEVQKYSRMRSDVNDINISNIAIKEGKYSLIRIEDNQEIVSNKNNLDNAKGFLKNYYVNFSKFFPINKDILQLIINRTDSIENKKEIFTYFPSFPHRTSFFHPMEIVRGCPQGCKYCQVSKLSGLIPRRKDYEIIKLYIGYQLKNRKNHFRFITPDFALFFLYKNNEETIKKWEEFINYIIQEGLNHNINPSIYLGSFPSELSLKFLKPEILNLIAKYSATKKVTIGIQTASKNLQKKIGRNDPLDDLIKIINYAESIEIEPIIDIIFGLPYESEEDRDITLTFLEKYCSKNITANLHYFLPIPGTEFEDEIPAELSKNEIDRINKLIGKGFVSGNFFKQMIEFEARTQIPVDYLQNP